MRRIGYDDRLAGADGAGAALDAAVELARAANVRIVSLMHVGSDGWLKALDFAPRDEDHLRAILRTGERADGSSLFPGTGIDAEASDVLLSPRPGTAFLDPFAEMPTLAVLCGHRGRDGAPLAQSPDTIVRAAAQRQAEETGHDLWALGEVEFFLGRTAVNGDLYGHDDRGYHAASPFVFGAALRRRALVLLADMGVPVKYAHSEVGWIEPEEADGVVWEQHEIELDLLPVPEAADAIVLTQWVVRNLAHESGMRCSTDPIMIAGHPGNGLHLHLSPRLAGSAVEVGAERLGLSEPARWLIGGLVLLGGALMAFGNRSPDSLTRLRQGREAPRGVRWGAFDRSALVRLPVVPRPPDGAPAVTPTVEFRLPDGSAHPHLVLAGVAQAMALGRHVDDLDALLAHTEAGADRAGAEGEAEALPASLEEIGAALARRRGALEAGEVFPAAYLDRTIAELRGGVSRHGPMR